MLMLKYKCPLCGRIHYSREGLKAGYCTTCGPKGRLVLDIDWKKVNSQMIKMFNEGTRAFRELANAIETFNRIKLWN